MFNTEQEAAAHIREKLKRDYRTFSNTNVFIKNCIVYDFGWYFQYDVSGEMLAGGPDYGHFVHKLGYLGPVHYVGTPWNTGIRGKAMFEGVVKNVNGVLHPLPHVVRHFKKQVKMKELDKQGKLPQKTFKTDKDYLVPQAVRYLKIDLCMVHQDAEAFIEKDSGINITRYKDPGYDDKFKTKVRDKYIDMVNEGLFDENWDEYYGME